MKNKDRKNLNRDKLTEIIYRLEIYGYKSWVGSRNLADLIVDEYEK